MKTYSGIILIATYACIALGILLIKPTLIPDAAFIVFCLSGFISGNIDGFKGMKSALLAMGTLVIIYLIAFTNSPQLLLNLIVILLSFALYFIGHFLGSLIYKPGNSAKNNHYGH